MIFSTFLSRIACCSRESTVDIGVTEFPTKTAEKEEEKIGGLRFFLKKVGVRIPFSVGNVHSFGRRKTNFFGGGV